MKKYFIFVAVSFLLTLIFTVDFIACSCNRTPDPPCRSYWETPVIFEGVVTEFVPVEDNSNGYENRRAKLIVKKAYKGINENEVFIFTGDGGSDCGFPFKKDESYLIYGYGENGYLTTNYCTRTRSIKYAKEDLDYLSNLNLMKDGALIYGNVKKYAFGYGDDENFGLVKPISGIRIKIEGTKEYNVKTDKDGKFQIQNVPEGNYLIQALLPKNLKFSVHTPEQMYFTQIKNKGCAEANFYVDFEGEIKGKVLDEKGNPVKGITAQLVSADYKFESKDDMAGLLNWTLTKDDGSFRFTGLPSGRYFIGIGIGGAHDVFSKEGRVFYPNTDDPAKATKIQIIEGVKLPEFILPLPKTSKLKN